MEPPTEQAPEDCQPCQQPSFRGCIVCYSAEWGAYALKRAYRAVVG